MKNIPDEVFNEFLSAHLRSIVLVGGLAFTRMTVDEVDQIAAGNDLLYAAWPDANIPIGFQIIPIKGWDDLPDSGGVAFQTLPCPDEATALKWLKRFGKPEWANNRIAEGERAQRH